MINLPIDFKPIGLIHSEHVTAEKTPIQPVYAKGCKGEAVLFPEYAEGLADLDGFSHIYLIYYFHQAPPQRLTVKPFLQDIKRGLFATRAPGRPNAIGLSIVELLGRKGCALHLDGLDILDNTPLLDIKPYTAKFDCIPSARNGWLGEVDEETTRQTRLCGYAGPSTAISNKKDKTT